MERAPQTQSPGDRTGKPIDEDVEVEEHARMTGPSTRPSRYGNGHAPNGLSAVPLAPPEPTRPTPPARRSFARPFWIIATCAIDGALIAALLTVAGGTHYSAETLLEVRPDPPVLQQESTSLAPDEADRYLQTEILAIQSSFDDEGLGRDGSLTVEQVGVTDVLSMQIEAGDAATAVRLAGEATDRYVADRAARSVQRIQEVTDEVQAQLGDVTGQIDQLATASPDDQSANARRNALSAEYQRLVGTQHDLDLAKLEAAPITVLSSAAEKGATRTDRPVRSAALGGVLGVVLGLAGILLWQRRPGARDREAVRREVSHA